MCRHYMQRALPIYEKRVEYHHDADELQILASLTMEFGRLSDALEYANRAASIRESNRNTSVEDYMVSFHMNLLVHQ